MTEKEVLGEGELESEAIPPMMIVTLVNEFTMSSVSDDVSIVTVVPEKLIMLELVLEENVTGQPVPQLTDCPL